MLRFPDREGLACKRGQGVAGRRGYRGLGLQAVDDKGRVAIPSGLRQTLERNIGPDAATKDGRIVVVSYDEAEGCIMAYDEPYFEQLHAELTAAARDAKGLIDRNVLRAGIGPTDDAQFDGSGRFIIPGHLKRAAGITRHAFFYGVGDVFEIWDPARLEAHPRAPAGMKQVCRDLLAEKGAS